MNHEAFIRHKGSLQLFNIFPSNEVTTSTTSSTMATTEITSHIDDTIDSDLVDEGMKSNHSEIEARSIFMRVGVYFFSVGGKYLAFRALKRSINCG